MNTFTKANKRPSQRVQVLNKLRAAGERGITNIELYEVCQRWQARLSELYALGYKVSLQNLGDGVYNYVLAHQPDALAPKPMKAKTIVTRSIEVQFDGKVTTAQLLHILASNGLEIKRKTGYYTV
ncbi:MAG TPA: hypothetical protein VGI33_14585 [Paenibacillus sp.]|jgi:hypothetical protein